EILDLKSRFLLANLRGKLKKSQEKKPQVDHSQGPRVELRRDKVFPLEGYDRRAKEDFQDMATSTLGEYLSLGPKPILGSFSLASIFCRLYRSLNRGFLSQLPSLTCFTKSNQNEELHKALGELQETYRSPKSLHFLGDCKPYEYVDWELKVDQIVSSVFLHGRKVVRLATLEFCGYALVWWNQVLEEIMSDKRGPCEGWRGLKRLMRERFIPSSYVRDFFKGFTKYHMYGRISYEDGNGLRSVRRPQRHSSYIALREKSKMLWSYNIIGTLIILSKHYQNH
ncbi:hypothetical protein CR513_14793, partial [Mucuna pruriens]